MKFCNKCGNELKEGVKFCSKCGNEISNVQSNNTVAKNINDLKSTEPKKNKKALLIILGLILLIAVVILIVFFMKNKESNVSNKLNETSTAQNIKEENEIEEKEESEEKKEDNIEIESVPNYDNMEEISLSESDSSILSNLICYGNEYLFKSNYTKEDIKYLINFLVVRDNVINFPKISDGSGFDTISKEVAIKILEDGFNINIDESMLDINSEGTIKVSDATGDGYTKININKVMKNKEDYMMIYATSVRISDYDGVKPLNSYIIYGKENAESIFGYTLLESEKYGLEEVVIKDVSASSVLTQDGNNTYFVNNIKDNNLSTAWVEGVNGLGIGENINFEFNGSQKVSGMAIANGYCKSNNIFDKNSRVKKVLIEFSDGTSIEKELDGYYSELSDENFGYTDFISFEGDVNTEYIRVTILDAYMGSAYEDTCISEVKFFK